MGFLISVRINYRICHYKKAIPNYAVNGAAYYASVILRHTEYNEVLCIGVNGFDNKETNEKTYEIKAYISNKDNIDMPIFVGEFSDMSFLFLNNQVELIKRIEDAQIDPEELHRKAILDDARLDGVLKDLNNHLRNESKIRTGQRIFVVAACIMAALGVKDKNKNYTVAPLKPSDLRGSSEDDETDGDKINRKVKSFLAAKNLPQKKQDQIDNALKQVILFSNLSIKDPQKNISPLKSAYSKIVENVVPAYEMAGTLDFTGKLFNVMNEWVDVPDGDTNDVVLTPRYITNMMAKITEVDMNSYVWDWALGSGGFLISAMNLMVSDAKKREKSPDKLSKKINNIKSRQLLGIEKLPDIYILAVLNMILMGDGSANIGNEDSLKDFDGNYIYDEREGDFPANVFLLNPPYSAEGNGMIFVQTALSKMKLGKAAVIIQDSAGNGKSTEINKEILKNNRLLASIKMPGDIFDSGVQTSIYLFEVGKEHTKDDIVKFINFDVDGYKRNFRRKAKHHLTDDGTAKQRYDDLVNVVKNGNSKSIFFNDDNHYVEDVIDPQNGNDWNFEKHEKLELNPVGFDFDSSINSYISWEIKELLKPSSQYEIDNTDWKLFKASDLFNIESIIGINKDSLTVPDIQNIYDYVTRTSENRGILQQTGVAKPRKNGTPVNINDKNIFSMGLLQMTIFYREREWYAGQFVRKIIPKFEIDKDLGLFFEILFNKQRKLLGSEIVSDVDNAFNNMNLLLPVTQSKEPDYDKMRSITMNLRKSIENKIISNLS